MDYTVSALRATQETPQMLLSSFLRPAPPGGGGERWFISSLSVSYRHDFLLAGLTFPSLAASVPFYD